MDGLQAGVHPDLLLGLLAAFAAYLLVLVFARRQTRSVEPVQRSVLAAFAAALFTIYLAEGTLLHTLAESYLFSAHMVQHLLLALVLPPLVLQGLPEWLAAHLLRPRPVQAALRILRQPLVAILIFNLALSLYHLPAIYQAGLKNHLLHLFQHALLVGTGLMAWWPVTAPVRSHRLHDGLQVLYLFGQMVAQMAVNALVTFADHALYPLYAAAPRVWNLSPMDDQALAGFIMKVGGMAIYLPFLLLALKRWAQQELQRYPLDERSARGTFTP